MGDVIHVEFGTDREWEATRKRILDGLLAIGALFGDDPQLLTAKAEVVYQILRDTINEVPSVSLQVRLPVDLDPEQLGMVQEAIKEAALKGIESTMTHGVQVLMSSIYDLCTSKLAQER